MTEIDKFRPGQYPFTSGIYPEMYRQHMWTMRQYSGFGSAEGPNKRYHYLLEQGVTGLSPAFDLHTQIGYYSDHPLAEGEVGRVGVNRFTVNEPEAASLQSIDPRAVKVQLRRVKAERSVEDVLEDLERFKIAA